MAEDLIRSGSIFFMLIEPRRNVSKVVLSLAGNPFDGAQGTVAITTL